MIVISMLDPEGAAVGADHEAVAPLALGGLPGFLAQRTREAGAPEWLPCGGAFLRECIRGFLLQWSGVRFGAVQKPFSEHRLHKSRLRRCSIVGAIKSRRTVR